MEDSLDRATMRRYAIEVSGKVQGVFFRASTKQYCERYGITGFVRNLADGKVYIEAEGYEDQLSELLLWCKEGPPLAEVIDIQQTEIPLKGEKKFRIVRL